MKRVDPTSATSSSSKKPKTKKRDEIISMNLCNEISINLMLTNMKKPETDQENIVSSPMSINLLLNMLANGFEEGSAGRNKLMTALGFKTIDEINRVSSRLMKLMTNADGQPCYEDSAEHKELMDVFNNGPAKLSSRIYRLMDKHNKSYGKPSLLIASGVWADRAYPFKPRFVETATRVYQSCTETLDFSDESRVVENVNSWAEKRTKGLIKGLVSQDSLSSNDGMKTILIFANSLFFKARWAEDFSESLTGPEKFYLLDGTDIEVPFMKNTSDQHYCLSLDGFKLLRLPYRSPGDKTRKFSMYLFLPELQNGLKPLLERFKLDPSLVHTACESTAHCITWIPKFSISFAFQPSDVLKTKGLDLSEMGMATNMIDVPKDAEGCVSKVIQNSYIEVNEKGTKAASASLGDLDMCASLDSPPRPKPVRFVADHPFFFTVKDEVSGAVLFSGIICNPLLS